jgi:hypothetical protein
MVEKQRDLQKINYWAKRAAGKISAMRLAKETGLFPKSEGWRNVVEHELVEAEAADTLGEMLGLSTEERDRLREAALLHDVFKRKEIEEYAPRGIEGFDQNSEDQAEFLRNKGVPEVVIALTDAVAYGSLYTFIDSSGQFVPHFAEIPEAVKIAHYIDDITKGSRLVPLSERISALKANQKYKELDERGRQFYGGMSNIEAQEFVSRRIEAEFSERLGIEDPTTLPLVISQRIEERIRAN